MDLAAQNGIKVIIATLDTAAPEWTFRKFPDARYKASDDSVTHSSVSASSGVGGFPGLCLDNPEVAKGYGEEDICGSIRLLEDLASCEVLASSK
jgi:beta-galactosidase